MRSTQSNYFKQHFANSFIIICPFEKRHTAEPFKMNWRRQMLLKNGENKKKSHNAHEKKLPCQLPFSISYQFLNGHWYSSFISFHTSPKTNKSSLSGHPPCRKEWKKVHELSLFCINKLKSYSGNDIALSCGFGHPASAWIQCCKSLWEEPLTSHMPMISLYSALSRPLTYTHWHMWGNRVGSRRIFTQFPDKSLIKSWLCSTNSLALFESKTANIPVYLAWVDIQLTRPASHRGHLSIPCFKCTCLITCYLQLQQNEQANNNYLESFSVEKQTPHERKRGWVLSVDVPAMNNHLMPDYYSFLISQG